MFRTGPLPVIAAALLLCACPPPGGPDAGATFTVGGTVTGLLGSGLALQNNLQDDLAIAENGAFTFPAHLASGTEYVVTVKTQPSSPAQTCQVLNYTGTIASSNVTDIAVTCTVNTYRVSGTVSGLAGTGLVLQNNAGDDLRVTANGSFTFPARIVTGGPYSVTVKTQPTSPSQTCVVASGTGTIWSSDVTDVVVTCTTNTYPVGGTVGGLLGTGLVLQNNAGDDLPLSADGGFAFATPVASEGSYFVTVKTQPTSPAQTCVLANATGTVASAAITSVEVTCTTNTYSVSGTVSGLAGSGLVLQNNGGDDLGVTSNGSFTFATLVASGGSYSVSVKTQPASLSQTCIVTNATGTIGNSDVTDVAVTCTTNTYSVGGTVSGLAGSGLVLQNNAGDDLGVTSNGMFTFATAIANASAYSVSVKTQPSSPPQSCVVTNGSGTMGTSAVTDVSIACTTLYSLGGTISGVSYSGLVLTSPGQPDLPVSVGATSFTFATNVPAGSSYDVTVNAQPVALSCMVVNGSGIFGAADVTNVVVHCSRLWSQVAAGYYHTIGITADTTLWAWGSNSSGQLGNGSTTSQSSPILVGSGFASVAAGGGHTVAVKTDGTLWAWGNNYSGQLGNGDTTNQSSPILVGSGFASVAAGFAHTVAVKADGTLWVWGANGNGQLGNGNTTNQSSPIQVGSGFASVAASFGHTVAVKTDGTLWAWGYNYYGQLGNGNTTNQSSPILVGSGFASVVAGSGHTVAVKTDGTLWAWGDNSSGQLGNGNTTSQLSPIQVGSGFASVAAGGYHTVAVKTDGTLWAWGRNNFGQLGSGNTTSQSSPILVGSGFASVAAGDYHTVAVKTDGTLWAWGLNDYGQLGDGTLTLRLLPIPIP